MVTFAKPYFNYEHELYTCSQMTTKDGYRYIGKFAGIEYTVDYHKNVLAEVIYERLNMIGYEYLLDHEGQIIILV